MRNKQAGGIVSFIIVAVALAGLLAGGLYLSKQQGRTARDNDTSTPQVSITETKDKTEEQKSTPPADQEESQQAPQGSTGSRQEQPRPTTNNATNGTSTPNNRTDRVATTGPSTVPSTGPTETVVVSLALGVIVFTSYRFVQSRRTLRASALHR